MTKSFGPLSGSRPTGQAPTGLDGSRFDPGRVASRLGKRQRAVILSLGEDWGKAACHQTAKRMFWGVQGFYLVNHKHRTDNCWALTTRGLAVKDALLAQSTEKQP
jgi:hypothetical protein